MWYIESTSDSRRYPIPESGVTIGRRDCTINIPDTDRLASRHHANVRRRGDVIEVEDNGSTNGTFLGTVRVQHPMVWTPGVPLRCGSATFHLVGEGDSVPDMNAADDPLLQQILTLEEYTPPSTPEPSAPTAPTPSRPRSAPAPSRPTAPAPAPSTPAPSISIPSLAPSLTAPAPSTSVSATPAKTESSPISTILIGLVMLTVGIVWWQYLRGQITSMETQLITSAPELRQAMFHSAMTLQLLFLAAVILSCAGGAILFVGIANATPKSGGR